MLKENNIRVWEEKIIIPTYAIGKPEKNPMFLEKRVYQGSSGVVYPHAVVEKISDEKSDKLYTAVFLENRYLKIMILPELGGRVQMAFDKIKNRHFVYYNQVIKPALVGLTGPWISGGIEFNWPQHHRPSTFEQVDYTIKENDDGSKTVWVNEVERMFRTKGMAGFTLYPDKAYLEIKVKLYNRTPLAQTFLWWANPAVKVNDHYQSVFPPDVNAVFDHGKRDVSSFPIATGKYYKVDYSPGTDISMYKNIPVPTSFMAASSKYDFIGGYEHDTKGGLLHVADHHVSPGKKQWTWGNGEFGLAWDKNLTDEDGPYIELMTGAFTDNQPDFSWLQPYEEKEFVQYFMPYSEVGLVKNATKDVIINIEFENNRAEIKLYATAFFERLKVSVEERGVEIFADEISCSPENSYLKEIVFGNTPDPENIKLIITDVKSERQLVAYKKEKPSDTNMPTSAQAAKRPEEIESNEQLYLTGLHLEQYRHATYIASDYYEEALKRDSTDVRNNNALGLWFLRKGKFKKSEQYFRKAISSLVQRNPNPFDGEPYYNLGVVLKMQNKNEEAFDAFYKSSWNDAWQHAAYLNLARIAVTENNYDKADEFIDKSINKNFRSHTARHLKTIILRKRGKDDDAFRLIAESLEIDPFNFGCMFEKIILQKNRGDLNALQASTTQLIALAHAWVHNFIEYALDYANAGLFREAEDLLLLGTHENGKHYPLAYYYLGWFADCDNDIQKAKSYFGYASSLNPDLCFSNRLEDVLVLQRAIELSPQDARALYYLGNFWYDKRQYADAICCWEKSAMSGDRFPTVHRNLALAYYNKLNDPEKAVCSLEKAFRLDPTDARVLMELDQLHKRLHKPHEERLAFLESHLSLVMTRDDLFLERITLYNQLGNYEKAKSLIGSHKFHPWEGGEGKVISQYLLCHVEMAKEAIDKGDYVIALQLLTEAESYPENLGEGKLYGAQENDIFYFKAIAYERSLMQGEAQRYFQKATIGITEPVQAIFYNDAQPDKIFYQGMAWQKLGLNEKANSIFQRLIDFAKQHIDDDISIDYFAVSLPDLLVFDADLTLHNKVHCLYMMGLGYLGLGNGNVTKATACFNEVLILDNNHQGASVHRQMSVYAQLEG